MKALDDVEPVAEPLPEAAPSGEGFVIDEIEM